MPSRRAVFVGHSRQFRVVCVRRGKHWERLKPERHRHASCDHVRGLTRGEETLALAPLPAPDAAALSLQMSGVGQADIPKPTERIVAPSIRW